MASLRIRDPFGGERVVSLHGDAVTEALNEDGDQFGDQRLLECLARQEFASAEAMVQHVREQVAAFRGRCEPSDDVTVLACREGRRP